MKKLQGLTPLLYVFIVLAVLAFTPTLACVLFHSTSAHATFAWGLVSF
jgi:hypothetical protein